MNLKEYVTKKGSVTTSFKAFNEYLIEDKLVYNSLNELLIKYADIDFKEFLKMIEFQYLRSVLKNEKELKIGDDYFNEISILYSLADGKMIDITGMYYEKYNELMKETKNPLIVDCKPHRIAAEFSNNKGEGAFIAKNDLPNDRIFITTWETRKDKKEIKNDFILDIKSNNKDYEIIKNKQESLVKER